MTQLYHYTFAPWRCDGGKRVVADEAEWMKPIIWGSTPHAILKSSRVLVDVDVFEDWRGYVLNDAGEELYDDGEGAFTEGQFGYGDIPRPGQSPIGTVSVLARLFRIIDRTPNLDWMLVTEHPENVKKMWPKYDNDYRPGPDNVPMSLGNLWLGVRASTQSELDARVPHLLRAPAAKRVLWLTPREEIRLEVASGECHCGIGMDDHSMYDGHSPVDMPHSIPDGIDWVVVEGCDEPMHPEWVRGISDQCQSAGVPFFFKQWGEWSPHDIPCRDSCVMDDASGGVHMFRIGKSAAGRTLDGREWSEVPA